MEELPTPFDFASHCRTADMICITLVPRNFFIASIIQISRPKIQKYSATIQILSGNTKKRTPVTSIRIRLAILSSAKN